MDRFETEALNNYPLKPLIWKRFIDDIFLIWTHGEDSLKDFVDYLNSLHPTIKFISETSTKSVNFLDITVKLDQNRNIITTLYNKPTDTHLFLHHTSACPSSVTNKGPYGQYLCLRRICTLDSDFEENADKLSQYYLKRGYQIKQLKHHHERVKKFSQELLEPKTSKNTTNTPPVMVTKYNPKNPNIKKFIHSNWNMIEHCDELKKIFTQKPLIEFRRLPNLRDMLTNNNISYPQNQQI